MDNLETLKGAQLIRTERAIQPTVPEIVIAPGLLAKIPELIASAMVDWRGQPVRLAKTRLAVISDSTVASLYGERLVEGLRSQGLSAELFTFPEGEANKTQNTIDMLEGQMRKSKGFSGNTSIIALGGGVTGDMAGFLAATYNRGILLVHIPTSLMAQIDSCIGGKVGVDTQLGKNLRGTFHEPVYTFIDPEVLISLPPRHFRNGLAEIIKYGLMDDDLMELITSHLDTLVPENMRDLDLEFMQKLIYTSIGVKNRFVTIDPYDRGVRRVLNFGHTYGHGVERASDYRLLHGEAVAIGMVQEGKIAVARGIWSQDDLDQLVSILNRAGLSTEVPEGIDPNAVLEAIRHDKKRGNVIVLAIPSLQVSDPLILLEINEDELPLRPRGDYSIT